MSKNIWKSDETACPVAFTYGDVKYSGFLQGFEKISQSSTEENGRIVCVCTYVHTASKTQWTVRTVQYPAYGATEWQAELTATEDTDVFSHLRYMFTLSGKNGKVLGNRGDKDDENVDYTSEFCEYEKDLSLEDAFFESVDGRPTHGNFPYFRVETDEQKNIVVLSWQGTWYARFSQKPTGVEIDGGQSGVHTKLYKGETFRFPLAVVLSYDSDPINSWRRFFIDCNMPKVDGDTVKPLAAGWNGQCDGLSDSIVRKAKQKYAENGIDIDMWWFDAGLGTDGTGPHNPRQQWWHGVNFEINYENFPDGLDAFGRELEKENKKFLMWFEPEAVRTPPSEMDGFYAYHPDFKKEWFVGLYQYEWCGQILSAHLLDLGNAECLTWLENKIFEVMDTTHANVYRQDFNIPPASVWQKADGADRKGITENKYCQGYLKLLQDIRKRYAGIMMDSCASGGGRLDLETMRLMFPLHYSDYQDVYPGDAETRLYMTQIISRWFPYYKNSIGNPTLENAYTKRSAFAPLVSCGFPVAEQESADYAAVKDIFDEWRIINKAYLGDYFELETPTRNKKDLKAYMLYDKAKAFGFALVCAPSEFTGESYVVKSKGLDENEIYLVKDVDTGERIQSYGYRLMKKGFTTAIAKNQSRLFTIEKIKVGDDRL